MEVRNFRFEGFRNLKNGEIIPSNGVNIIYGDNAQGKTNIIEAMWMFTGGKSFRGAKEKDLIEIGNVSSKAYLNMKFFSELRDQSASIIISEDKLSKRQLTLNEVKKKTIADIIGKFCAVVFSPVHLALIKSGPNNRRKFIDSAICQIKPTYVFTLSKYNKILMQRNALLKDIKYNKNLSDTLFIWNEKLAQIGSTIISERLNYCDKLMKYSRQIYSGISDNKENISIRYKTSVESDKKDLIEEQLMSKFKESLKEDMNLGFTTRGPHREDLEVKINEMSAKSFASQGQQRSAVLALKLSEAKILKDTINESPIIFLDDVMSELDISRQRYLSNNIREFQTFITCCDPSILDINKDSKLFLIDDGYIKS